MINADLSAGATVINPGSSFLERLGKTRRATGSTGCRATIPAAAGRPEAAEAPRFRTWFEGYGISARNDVIGDFVGDRRKILAAWPGSAPASRRASTLGFSVDQSHTGHRRAAGACSRPPSTSPSSASTPPSTRCHGPGRIAVVHGFGQINSRRDTGLGLATAWLQRAPRAAP